MLEWLELKYILYANLIFIFSDEQDNDGNIEGKMVTSKDVWKFQNTRVILHFDEDSSQPIGKSGGLLGSWICQLSNNANLLPINYSNWRLVSSHSKNKAWEVIQVTHNIFINCYNFELFLRYYFCLMNYCMFYFSVQIQV